MLQWHRRFSTELFSGVFCYSSGRGDFYGIFFGGYFVAPVMEVKMYLRGILLVH